MPPDPPGNHPAPGNGRRTVAALWAAAAMPFLLLLLWVPAARAADLLGVVPTPAVVALGMLAGVALVGAIPRLASPLPESLDDWLAPRNRPLAALWGVGGLLALMLLGRAAVFLGDASYTGASLMPGDPFLVHHSCLTAYMHGAILSMDPAANVYDMAFVDAATHDTPPPATAAPFAPFKLDAFGYPPPFLLLPRALLLLSSDFMVHRAWFGAGSLLLTLFACARSAMTLGGLAGRRLWLLAPLFLSCAPVLVTLQVGNFHLIAVALCLLCWVALEEGRDGVAGVLLAVALLAKIFPGLLGVLLLVNRRWRAVGATAASAAALVALAAAVLGTQVWRDFLFYHLPKIQSGEALRFMAESDQSILFNLAPFGIPFKLAALGLPGWGWPQARAIGSAYTALLFALAWLAGRNRGTPRHRLTVWLAVVMVASLRSPYAAPFVLSTITLLLLAMTAEVRSWKHVVAVVVTLAFFSIPVPIQGLRLALLWSLTQLGLSYLFFLWVLLRRERPSPALP